MTGLPTLQVTLQHFLNPTPFDITAFVRWIDGYSWSRGTPDEQSSVSNGTVTIALDNTDGRFTLGSATYGIFLDQGIQILVNGVARFSGRIQSWPVSWPEFGADTFSVVTATGADDFARAQRRILQAAVVEDILLDSPAALYQLSEDAGATMAADSSGNALSSLAIAGTGTALTFGSGIGPVDGLTCATFFGGTFLRGTGSVYLASGTAASIETFFTTTQTPASVAPILQVDVGDQSGAITLSLSSTGKLQGTLGASLTSAASVNDGLVHHAALTITSGGVLTLYLDGVSVGTGVSTPLTAAAVRFSIAPTDVTFTTPFAGTVAHAAVTASALSGSAVAVHYAGVNDYSGETAQHRFARIAAYVGIVSGTIDSGGTTTMGPANQGGKAGLDMINEVTEATQGTAILNGAGSLVTRNGYTMTGDTGPDASLDANWFDEGTVVEADLANTVNFATGKATNSENVFFAQDANSLITHGMYRSDYEWNVATDTQALDRTNWRIGTYASVQSRFPTLTLDLLSLSGSNLTAALTLDVGKFLHITGLPSQNPGGAIVDLIVFGITETLTTASWTLTLNCVRHNLFAAWLLGDATWGVLNSTTKLYF